MANPTTHGPTADPAMTDEPQDEPATPAGRVLVRAIAARKTTAKALSLRAGLNETAASAIIIGKSRNPRSDTLRRLSVALGMAPGGLSERIAHEAMASGEYDPAGDDAGDLAPFAVMAPASPAPATVPAPRDVPIYATRPSRSTVGAFALDLSAAIEYTPRPPGIASPGGLFAIRCPTAAMEPRHQVGALLYCHPGRPAATGHDALVVWHKPDTDGAGASACMLVTVTRQTDADLVGRTWNPPADHTFTRDQVDRLVRILTLEELLGA